MPLTYAAAGTIQPLPVVRKKVPSVAVEQGWFHEATTEGEERVHGRGSPVYAALLDAVG